MAVVPTLGMASPHTKGKRVTVAQQRLNGKNVFKRDFLEGPVDGEFGELTGRACRRAKFWLGYPDKELKATYGPTLDAYLTGKAPLTGEMKKRKAAREKKAAQTPMREKALTEAHKYVGVKESPAGSNKVRFSDWYGIRGPWCAMFVTWCYVSGAKSKAFVNKSRYAYVPYIVGDARAGRNGLSVTRDPKPGDVVCFDWEGNGVHDHVGLFKAGNAKSFTTIEGNTAVGNDSNGGAVMERSRNASSRPVFVRVGR